MGGSGGSDAYGGASGGGSSGGPGGAGPDCSSLAFEATVMSPDPAVVAVIAIGSMCEVLLRGTPAQVRLYMRDTGGLLGAITERWPDLTACIESGFAYEAEVIALRPTRVRITPRRPYRLVAPFSAVVVDVDPGAILTNGDHVEVSLDADGTVVVHAASGNAVGRIAAEPVALPEALSDGCPRSAHVDDAAAGRVVITDI